MKIFLIGGFLGSGKSTAIQQACLQLLQKGIKVGVITNDQGVQLVDTKYISSFNIPTLEVTDGCFCCNYHQFDNSISSLTKNHRPEFIFAESVGSCTDLVATVVKPLLKFHPDMEVFVSVFADASILPLLIKESKLFVNSVKYIYKKQLEEADLLVVNKIDMLNTKQLKEIKQLLKSKYPDKTIIYQNSLNAESIRQWLIILNTLPTGFQKSLELNYDIYGAGEAELAWYDAELEIYSAVNNAVKEAGELISKIYSKIREQNLTIGHLKFFLNDGKDQMKISFTSGSPYHFAFQPVKSNAGKVDLLINARVQADPDRLKETVAHAIEELCRELGCKVIENKTATFQPGYPNPTYRSF